MHSDQLLQVPFSSHVRVCVPQLPHDSDATPEHVHFPPWHVEPVVQTFPQTPQLLPSEFVSLQVVPQLAYPALHMIPQELPAHIAWPCAGTGQALPHPPQLFASVAGSVHDDPHTAPEQVETHAGVEPLAHIVEVPVHALPQDPQWVASFRGVSQPLGALPSQSP